MTNEEILKLAKAHGFDNFQRRKFDGGNDYGIQWGCWEEQLLNFALAIHEKGKWDGEIKGYYKATGGRAID